MASIRRTNSNKNNFKKDLKMENNFNPFDKVLVRDGNAYEWQPELFYKINEEGKYCTLGNVEWSQCIPYEGNEHLMDTSNMPEFTDLKNNILKGIKLEVGYVLEFKSICNHKAGVIIPTEDKKLAISYLGGGWDYLENIIDTIKTIKGPLKNDNFTGGMLLWQKNNK